MPETVTTLGALRQRADELGCGRALAAFLSSLERCFDGYVLSPPVPIAIVLCAGRPFHLIGSPSDIELLPYVVELRAGPERASLFAAGDDEPAAPATQLDIASPALLRRVSGALETGPVVMLGCGSLGSKMASYLARSGVHIAVVSDRDILLPHNMARHALARPALGLSKAAELARELTHLGQSPGSTTAILSRTSLQAKAAAASCPRTLRSPSIREPRLACARHYPISRQRT